MYTSGLQYKRAFEAYLRKGTPIRLCLKQAHPTPYYIWRTRKDDRVRPTHAANEGKVFAWDKPPPTGHPGEDYGCRCTAEPYLPNIQEYMTMEMFGISDSSSVWSDGVFGDFVNHYRNGNGRAVRLRDTGHLQNVVNEYWRQVETRLLGQIADAARKNAGASFSHDFGRPYNVRDIVFSLGMTTIGGVATGISRLDKTGTLSISGQCNFYLEDSFKDAIDVLNAISGDNLDVPGAYPYRIYDKWQGRFGGVVIADRNFSQYAQN